MNLKNEYSELKKIFKEAGPLTKIYLVLSLFFTLSSVTTLSSTIVDWKGFILEGINFYTKYYVDNVLNLASMVGLKYTEFEVHAATILCLTLGIGIRIIVMGQKVAFRVINEKYNTDLKPSSSKLVYLWVITTLGVWIYYGLFNPVIIPWVVILVTVLYPPFLILPKMVSKNGYHEKEKFSYVKSYYAYMFVILLIVGILAAINKGLSDSI